MKTEQIREIFRGIIGVLLLVGAWFLLQYGIEGRERKVEKIYSNQEYSISVGKRIGRYAMLNYLERTNQIDSIKIDLKVLLELEDSLQVNYEKDENI